MKFIFLGIALGMCLFCSGQSNKDIIETLYKANLVSGAEKEKGIEEFKKIEAKNSFDSSLLASPYHPLYVLTEVKMLSAPGTWSGKDFIPAAVDIPKSQEGEYIAALTDFANKLRNANLISDKVHAEIVRRVKMLKLSLEFDIAAFAAHATSTEYFLRPKFFTPFADSLLSNQLISQDDYRELIARSTAGDLGNRLDYVKYLKNCVVINLNDYPADVTAAIEPICRKTATTLKGLSFDKFSYEIELQKRHSTADFKIYDMIVALEKDGRVYRQQYFLYGDHEGERHTPMPGFYYKEYYQVFNKILVDQQSPYRLHAFDISEDAFGIIALTQRQFDNLKGSYVPYDYMEKSYLGVSHENFNNKLTGAEIATAIKVYDSLGLFNHLSTKEKDSCIQALDAKQLFYYSDILSSFKNVVFDIDLEYGIADGQYKEITQQIAGISRGRFKPTAIVDNYNHSRRQRFNYGFTLNGKKYLTRLEQDDDWLDVGFFDLIGKAVQEQDTAGAFYFLYPTDGLRIAYLTHKQYNILKNKGLIELEIADVSH